VNWLRLYVDLPRDLKIRREPLATRWAWVVVLTLARRSPKPPALLQSANVPVRLADLVDEANISAPLARNALTTFLERGMLHTEVVDGIPDVWVVTNWAKRQPNSDDVRARVEAHRQRTRNVTDPIAGNVTETAQEEETDADAETDAEDVLVQQAAPSLVRLVQSGEGYSEAFLAFWSAYPRKREKHSAATVFERNVAKLKVPAAEMIAAARNFGAHCEQRGTEAEFIPLPATFLGPKRKWKDWVRGVVDEGRSRGPQPKGWQSLKELRDLEGDDDQAAS
jgi:hypothetical protein